ncbi:Branched-chain amino acid aminotransferase [Enhygromyxa salina]|uniref:branched-chain-amino-acid transaminase n=1 Tax=Enhygromyxa salina TaxID=215803 RepID=A0A0C2D7J0_9BACT|nr:aminotransferase class IV [Enhygromyxa salina]KIG15992.1 Branched-chain amino acid aminotransferase [Enhygromyxa salina]
MSTKVWLSTHARVLDPRDANISVFDRGFLYGDSVYETLRTAGGRVVELGPHLDRLRRSAQGIAFDLPFTDAELTAAVNETVAAAANPDSRIRVVVTRGSGPIALDTREAESPVLVVMVSPIVIPTAQEYARGISAVIVGREGAIRPGLKTGNYLGNILALRHAHELGAEDAIMCNDRGEVAEGATSNLFMVVDGSVHTPSLATGLLAGITRGVVIRQLAQRLGIATCERSITAEELNVADEVFLTSSVRGVMPVTTLGGKTVGNGTAGPVTRRVQAIYEEFLTDPQTDLE